MDLSNSPQLLATQTVWYLIPVMVFIASLLGSTHCLGMCGGIVVTLRPRLSQLWSYHLGRLGGYMTLGALAGLLGEQLLVNARALTWFAAALLGLTFIWMGIKIWQGEDMALRLPAFVEKKLHRVMGQSLKNAKDKPIAGLIVGLSSVFLPCGWLYTFILGAVATQSMLLGTVFLLAFWLGTVPILSAAPVLLNQWLNKMNATPRKVSSSLLILAGCLTLYFKLSTVMHSAAHSAGMMCH